MTDPEPLFVVVQSTGQATVQDGGRHGYRAVGVPQSGALDRFAWQAANALLGNPPTAAALEILVGGLVLQVLAPTTIALAGGDLGATVDQQRLPPWTTAYVEPYQTIAFGAPHSGARAYLAVAGGIDVAALLGSRSTYLAGGWGGLAGRAIQTRAVLHGHSCDPLPPASLPADCRPPYSSMPTLRCLPGPHWATFDPAARAAFTSEVYTVSTASNRMGYRLDGPPLTSSSGDLPSLGVLPGVVQVTPTAQPILLLADAQTTGGYPILAVVISADLPLAAQLLPGDTLTFAWTTPATAQAALVQQADWLAVHALNDITGAAI